MTPEPNNTKSYYMVHFTLKNILAVAALSLGCTAMAADNAPTFAWADYLQSSGGTIIKSAAAGAGGTSYWMGNATTDGDAVTINSEDIFTGETKVGTAATYNFVLFKAAADGTPEWNIHSTAGDYAAGKFGGVVEHGDNIYFAVSPRQYNANVKNNLIDAKGTKFEFGDVVSAVADRYYMGVVACATTDGEISWIKTINGPAGEKDCLNTQGIAVASDGTIVLAMQISKAVTFGTTTITPAATNQITVVLLDEEGNYVSHFAPEGTFGTTTFTSLVGEGDNFYFAGTVTPGASPVTFTLGGKEITSGTKISAFGAKASLASLKEGKMDWTVSLPTSPAEGQTAASYVDGRLVPGVGCNWFTAQFKGVIKAGEKTIASVQNAQNEGLIVKIDETGAIVEGAVSRTDFSDAYITGYCGMLQAVEENAYVFGYGMNANVGLFLREYNATTLAANTENAWSLATFAGSPTGNVYAYNKEEGTLFAFMRPNKPVTVMGAAQPQEITNFSSFCAKYNLPDSLKAGLESVTAEQDAPTHYYNLQGVEVTRPERGLYIEVKGNQATKVIL